MKILTKLRFVILLVLVMSLVIPYSVQAAGENQIYPNSIAGYPVIYVKTQENTVGLEEGEVTLVLYDKTPIYDQETQPPSRRVVGMFLRENTLPKSWRIEVVGGPGMTKEKIKEVHEQNQLKMKAYSEEIAMESTRAQDDKTFTIIRNNGPLYYTVDLISATIDEAPSESYDQDVFSFWMVNGLTDEEYFIQAGQKYLGNGSCLNVWADQFGAGSPVPTEFDTYELPYYSGDTYKFEVGLAGNYWYAYGNNLDTGGHDTVYTESTGTAGEYFVYDTNTSVFFENANTGSDWYDGFDVNPLEIKWARERRNDSNSYWLYESKLIIDSDENVYSATDEITGSLLYFGTAYIHLDELPIVE
ncbi:MAG: hypothetical protein JW762_02660 [Dehalococcoidales bacterium]|nr:hypothetical protein [Dehalococcoidales bacterium]